MRTLLISFGSVATMVAYSQSWCPQGAQWVYDTGSPWGASQVLLEYVGDTVVDGFMGQRIDRTLQITEVWGNDTLINSAWPPLITRTNNDIVWDWNGSVWDTLCWFSALPGDTWQPFWSFEEQCPDHALLVLDTLTTVVDGLSLRTLEVELIELGIPTGQMFTVRERIGGVPGFGFPGLPPCGGIYECYCTFSCYQDQAINTSLNTCELSVGLNGSELVDRAGPALLLDQGILTVSASEEFRLATVIVTDAIGREVVRAKGSGGSMYLDMRGFVPGVYVVTLATGQQRATERFVLR